MCINANNFYTLKTFVHELKASTKMPYWLVLFRRGRQPPTVTTTSTVDRGSRKKHSWLARCRAVDGVHNIGESKRVERRSPNYPVLIIASRRRRKCSEKRWKRLRRQGPKFTRTTTRPEVKGYEGAWQGRPRQESSHVSRRRAPWQRRPASDAIMTTSRRQTTSRRIERFLQVLLSAKNEQTASQGDVKRLYIFVVGGGESGARTLSELTSGTQVNKVAAVVTQCRYVKSFFESSLLHVQCCAFLPRFCES